MNAVTFDKQALDKLMKEVPTYKLITHSVLVDRLKINGSLARRALKELEAKGLIKPVDIKAKLQIYTRAVNSDDVEEKKAKPVKITAVKPVADEE